ncbi:MAG: PPC domain-containing DNA-binding protein [Thermoprotei archaeon]
MKALSVNRVLAIKVPRGSDLGKYITKLAIEQGIKTGIVTVIGSLVDPVIGYYDKEQDKYLEIELKGVYELVSGLGNISLKNGSPMLHLHVALGDRGGRLYGGHFIRGAVFVAEAFIMELKGEPISRKQVSNTLWLWDL